MKALVCEEPFKWNWRNDEIPTVAEGEVLVKIKRVGICGTDLHAFQGNQAFLTYPRVLGHELSGVIADPGTSGLKEGQEVIIIPYIHCGKCLACRRGNTNCCSSLKVIGVHQDGGMREYLSIGAEYVLPASGVDLDAMALVECLAIGAHAVRRGAITPEDTTVVVGAGPIGLGVVQFAKANGSRVIVVDVNADRLAFCQREFGAEIVTAGPDAAKQIAALTNGDLASVVVDATGYNVAMMESVNFCGHSAKLVYVGLSKKELSYIHSDIHKKELTILCSRNATRVDFARVLECLQNGKAVSSCMVTHRSSLDEMPEQFAKWLKPETGVVKAIVEVG